MWHTSTRCFGDKPKHTLYADYHDYEWGVPVHDDITLFKMLTLEGAQAGLSWETVLKKRKGYDQAFHHFDVIQVAQMSDYELENLTKNKNIIRNKLKIYGARKNAQIFINIQKEFGSFSEFIWRFTNGKPIINTWLSHKEVPTTTLQSDALSKELKNRGMTFVGSTIIYAYMQAIGMVNDHLIGCFRHKELS